MLFVGQTPASCISAPTAALGTSQIVALPDPALMPSARWVLGKVAAPLLTGGHKYGTHHPCPKQPCWQPVCALPARAAFAEVVRSGRGGRFNSQDTQTQTEVEHWEPKPC